MLINTVFSTAICFTPDWLRYGNACFKLFAERKTWIEAQDSCRSINSNLTSIHSADENDFVYETGSAFGLSSVWIGLNNLNSADERYEWIDGSNLTYTNWHDGEPNHSGNIENCTEQSFQAGKWNDLSCDRYHNLSYVCGKRLNLNWV